MKSLMFGPDRKMRRILALLATICSVLPFGCARVSPQAVALSELVSQRLVATQQSHEAFVQGYFGQSRERIEDFLSERWIPYFLEHFVEDASGEGEDLLTLLENASPFDDEQTARLATAARQRGIDDTASVLAAAADALGGGERGQLTLEFAEAAVGEIERKRRALLGPIDELERRTLEQLRGSYSQIQSAQDSVTSHLRSLADVQAQQDQLFDRAGLLETRDRLMHRAISVNESVTGVIDAGLGVVETIENLEASLRRAREAADGSSDD